MLAINWNRESTNWTLSLFSLRLVLNEFVLSEEASEETFGSIQNCKIKWISFLKFGSKKSELGLQVMIIFHFQTDSLLTVQNLKNVKNEADIFKCLLVWPTIQNPNIFTHNHKLQILTTKKLKLGNIWYFCSRLTLTINQINWSINGLIVSARFISENRLHLSLHFSSRKLYDFKW